MNKKTKKNTLTLRIDKPKIPKHWDYDESVKKVGRFVYKWKTLTEKMRDELWIAREKLSQQGRRTDLTSGEKSQSWSQYCKDIGSSRRVVNTWLFKAYGPLKFSEQKRITSKGKRAKKIRKRVSPGQLWILGNHILLCGDSTKKADVERLFDGQRFDRQRADICITSPPYNLGEITQSGEIRYEDDKDNLSPQEYTALLVDSTVLAISNCEYAFINLQQCARNQGSVDEYLYKCKDKRGGTMIWDKMHANPARMHNVCDSQFEFVYYFNEEGKKQIDTVTWRKPISDVIRISSKKRRPYSDKHKATFPVEFAAHFVDKFAGQNRIVYDAFGGTGSTLIACQELKRKCYCMEIKPRYCDIIIQWWEDYTNEVALLCDPDGTVWCPDYPESKTLWPVQ